MTRFWVFLSIISGILVNVPASDAQNPVVTTMPSFDKNPMWGNVERGTSTEIWGSIYNGTPPFHWEFYDNNQLIATGTTTDSLYIYTTYTFPCAGIRTIRLTVNGTSHESKIRVLINPPEPIQVNMRIEKGLRWLYKSGKFDGSDKIYWEGRTTYYTFGGTSASILAFEEFGHFAYHDIHDDPYAFLLQKGLRFILSKYSGQETIWNHPDGAHGTPVSDLFTGSGSWGTGNGKGSFLYHLYNDEMYANALGLMAIIMSRPDQSSAQNAIVDFGYFQGWSYYNLVLDALDMLYWCQGDGSNRGAWYYYLSISADGRHDGSCQQWPCLAMFFAKKWGINSPYWVIENLVFEYMYLSSGGGCGYNQPGQYNNGGKTGGKLVGLVLNNQFYNTGNPEAVATVNFIHDCHLNYGGQGNGQNDHAGWAGNLYHMYAIKKGLQLQQIQTLGTSNYNWYEHMVAWLTGEEIYYLPAGMTSAGRSNVNAYGQWGDGSWIDSEWILDSPIGTAHAILVLVPSVTEQIPVSIITGIDSIPRCDSIRLDGSMSYHMNPERSILRWDWDIDGDGDFNDLHGKRPLLPQNTYFTPGLYTIQLKVTDNDIPSKTNIFSSTLKVSDGDHAPIAQAIPIPLYSYNSKVNQSIQLSGIGSYDPDEDPINDFKWSWGCDTLFNNAFGPQPSFPQQTQPYNGVIGLRVNNSLTSVPHYVPVIISKNDLYIGAFSTAHNPCGDSIFMDVKLYNDPQSENSFSNILINFWNNDPRTTGSIISNNYYRNLPIGTLAQVTCSIPYTEDLERIYVYLDANENIDEWDEKNNLKSVLIPRVTHSDNDSVCQNSMKNICVLCNDDTTNYNLSLTSSFVLPKHGTVVKINKTTLRYTPFFGYHGEDTIQYIVSVVPKPNGALCYDTAFLYLKVLYSPETGINPTTIPPCVYDSICFSGSSSTPECSNPITRWLWNFGDPTSTNDSSNLENPCYTYLNPGSYEVILTTSNKFQCSGSDTQTVIISNSLPDAGFIHDSHICTQDLIHFNDTSTAWPGYPLQKWEWDFGDGTSEIIYFPDNPDVDHIFSSTGPFIVKLKVTNDTGCVDSVQKEISPLPSPMADFTREGYCYYDTIFFTDKSIALGGAEIVSYFWDFDDPPSGFTNQDTLQNPVHLFSHADTFNVMLIATNELQCDDTIIKPVIAYPRPGVEFTWSIGPGNLAISFQVDTVITPKNLIGNMIQWNFGDGTYATGIYDNIHIYPGCTDFTVSLFVTDTLGCVNEVTHTITVPCLPTAFFTYDLVCYWNPVCFTDLSSLPYNQTGYLKKWIWNFGDGSLNDTIVFPNNPNICHVFPSPDTFAVTLTVFTNYGYFDTYSTPVSYLIHPSANFIYSIPCQDQVVSFTDVSLLNGGKSIQFWDWNFGDPGSGINNTSNLQNPTHSFTYGDSIYAVRLIIENFDGCIDTVIKQVYVFPSPPVEFTHDTACLNSMVTFVADTTITYVDSLVSWSWNFGDGTPLSTDPVTTQHLYAAAGLYTASLTVIDLHGCQNSVSHTVRVNPLPVANFTWTSPVCQFDSLLFTDQSYIPSGFTGYVAKWQWDFGDGTIQTIVLPNSPNVYHTFVGMSTSYTVRLTVWSNNSCTQYVNKTVTLTPAPIANFSFSNINCEDQAIGFSDLSQENGGGMISSWLWNFDDPASGINNTSTLQNPTHTFAAPGTYNVLLTVTNMNNCDDTVVKPVTVNLAPVADFSADTACLGGVTAFTDLSTPNAASIISWSWNFGDGSPLSILPSPTHTYANYGTFTATLTITNSNGCIHDTSKNILVYPKPIPEFSYSTPACFGAPVNYTDLSTMVTGYLDDIVTWIWDFGDATPPVTINFPANPNISHVFAGTALSHTVRLTVITNFVCTDYKEHVINSIPSPLANFSFPSTTCEQTVLCFTDQSQANGGGSIVQWAWNFDDPASGINNTSTAQNPCHSFTGAAVYDVELIVTNTSGCTDTIIKAVTVNLLPVANFSADTACHGSVTTFTDLSVANAPSIISYLWNFGDGTPTNSMPDPTHTYSNYGTYSVTLTIVNSNGCTHSTTKNVLVYPKPLPAFTYSTPNCFGAVVSFTNQSTTVAGYIDNIVTWVWDFDDGTTQTINYPANPNVTHTFVGTALSHNVKLTVTTAFGCTDFIIHTVNSIPAPLASFTYPGSPCAQNLIQFTDLSQTNGGGNIVQWNWNFDDPASGSNNNSTAQNPIHSFSGAGTFNVQLIVTNMNGCKDTVVNAVVVNARPVANFTADTACLGELTHFTDLSTTSTGTIASRLWEFGDGQTGTGANPTHLYANPGTYSVKLTVTTSAGCTKDTTKLVIVYPALTAAFSYNSPACASDSINFVDLSFSPHGAIITWVWDFGDGSSPVTINFPANPNVSHMYANGGTYTVTLTVTNTDGCTDTKTNQVSINYAPLANFSYASGGCAMVGIQFTDLSQQNGGGAIISWSWNFGDPASGINNTSTLQNPTHAFSTGGSFNVNLLVTNINGCFDSVTYSVTINAAPVAQYSADTACYTSPTTFTDASTTGSGTVVGWLWDFGDPASGSNNTSTLQNPTHVFTNIATYNVTLEVTNSLGCVDDTTMQITVNPKPTAMFTYSAACMGSSTQFTDLSIATGSTIIAWLWDFGDGTGTSTLQNPSYTYAASGTYDVTLIVTNLLNCSDTVVMPVVVRANPTAAFSYVNFFCPQAQVNFQDQSLGAGSTITERFWIFEPGYTSNLPNPVHVFSQDDTTYMVTLIVTDNYGCKDTIVDSVYVKPGFAFTFNHDSVCYGYPSYFQPVNLATGDSLYSVVWNFGDPASGPSNTSYLYYPTHTFTGPGTYIVKLKAWDTDNCVDSVYREVTVYDLPQPAFSFVSQPCDSVVSFTDFSVPGANSIATWEWQFGDGTPPQVIPSPGPGNTTHIYSVIGSYQVTLVVTNSNGCVDSVTETIERYPCVNAIFISDTLVCARNPVIFADSSYPVNKISQWNWTFGDGLDTIYNTYTQTITHTYTNPGNYIVKLVINAMVSGVPFSDSTYHMVRIKATPEPYFSNTAVCFNQTTLFTDTSNTFGEPITSWYWTFGEPASGPGDTSTLQNPSHKYLNPGLYDVHLIVTNQWGCTDSLTKTTRVFDIPVTSFESNTACLNDPTIFTDLSTSADTSIGFWQWNFGVPNKFTDTSNLQNPDYIYDSTGNYVVRLIVKDYYGCKDTVDSLVVVSPTPLSAFTVTDYIDGMRGKLQLQNLSQRALAYLWDFGDGKTSSEENPIVTFTADGIYLIKLISFNQFGCTDTTFYKYDLLFKGLYIPNAFAPTSDNPAVKLFKPVGINLKNYHIQVFNTSGFLLWESTQIDSQGRPVEGWDGTFDGKLMPQGNYMWKASANFVDDSPWNGSEIGKGEASTMGTVMLIR